jgi:Family of unknown function (DUF6529)
VPALIHCVYALGFQTYSLPVLGCVLYGVRSQYAWPARRDAMPKWVIPVLGGFVFVSLIGLWATSSLWLFATTGVHS